MSPANRYLLITLLLAASLHCSAVVKTSTGSGLWTNAATWSPAGAPACGDSILIQAGHTVSLTAVDFDPCALKMTIVIRGKLKFTAPGKLELDCLGRIYIYSGGQIEAFNGATGNANAVMQCNSTWWNAGAGVYNGPGCIPPTTPGCASVLPVDLVDFQASMCGSMEVCISWATLMERSHNFFDLQRLDAMGEWLTISRFYGDGQDSRHRKQYTFRDTDPESGLNYYQLRQVDIDGQSVLSPVLAVNVTGATREVPVIIPQPSNGFFSIVSPLPFADGSRVDIVDALGQVVYSQALESGGTSASIAAALRTGMYVCRISSASAAEAYPLLIE